MRLDVTPNSGEGFLTGDAVNTAARLQAAALPMTVAVGALTHELTERVIVFEEPSHVSAKGKTKPVLAWRALHPVARTGLRTGGLTATPFIGREDESAFLWDAFAEATNAGEGRVVLVVGEPGIGKSRLLLEFARSVDERSEMVTWRQGRCLPYGKGVTFSALSEILKEHAGIRDSDEVATVESKLGAALPESDEGTWLRQRLRPLLGLAAPPAAREENFAAWTRFLELVALPGPAVLVLEDLHWAGAEMLEFVEHLSSRALESPLLIIATTRPELLERHRGTLTSEGDDGPLRITLAVLARSEVGLLVADLLADLSNGDPVEDLGPRVADLVGGNPLYAEQYVRLLLDGDFLTRTSGGVRLAADVKLPVPVTVQAVIAARLDALHPDHKAILSDAAVIGETFWLGGLARVSRCDVGKLDEALAALALQGFVRPVVTSTIEGESEYLFWHALARDVAYGGLPRKARARKHKATADWLETAACGRGEFAEVIAHHLVMALDLARSTGDQALADSLVGPTVEALSRAGQRALRLDVAAAERHFAGALELAGADDHRRLRILPGWAETLLLRNRYREAAAAYEEAIAGFRASGDIRAAALAMVWLVDVLYSLSEPSSDLMRAAVDLLADDGPSAELAEVLSHYALSLMIQDADPPSVLEAAGRAIATCRLLALPESAVALSCRGGARLLLGDHAGLADVERAVAVAASQGLGIERATLEINLSSQILAVRGAPAERAALLEAHEFVRRHGIDVHAYSCRGALVHSLYRTGDWDEALKQAALLLPELKAIEHIWNLVYLRSLQALLASSRGHPAEAAPFVDWLAEEGRQSEVGWARAAALLAASTVRLQAGEAEIALDLLAQCFSEPRACISIMDMVPEAVRTAVAAGSDALAAGIVRQVGSLLPPARLPLEQHVVASVHGLVEERSGEHAAAAAHFTDAAAGWRDFQIPYEEAQALLGRGRCLVALGRAPEAAAPLTAAREIFARLGARPALEEAHALLTTAGL